MSRRPSSIALLLVALAAAGAAIWVISTRSRPALAVYDSVPAPQRPSDTLAADTLRADTVSAGKLAASAADSAMPHPRTTSSPRARSAATTDTARHPHRSDNYGGYSGYGSKERRGDPNAR